MKTGTAITLAAAAAIVAGGLSYRFARSSARANDRAGSGLVGGPHRRIRAAA